MSSGMGLLLSALVLLLLLPGCAPSITPEADPAVQLATETAAPAAAPTLPPPTPIRAPPTSTPVSTSTPIAQTNTVVVTSTRPLDTPTATPIKIVQTATAPIPSGQAGPEASSDIVIVEMSCFSQPEWVSIVNDGITPQALSGWRLHDEGEKATFDFPNGYVLRMRSAVRVWSYGQGPDGPDNMHWTNSAVWNNTDGDTAYLFDAAGKLVSQMSCRQ